MMSAFDRHHERRVDAQASAFDAGLRGQGGHPLERRDVFGPAVGIARVVERVDADDEIARAERLRPRQRQRQEDRVAGRDVGRRDRLVDRPILGHRGGAGQRRGGDAAQVEIQLGVAADAERPGDGARGLDLARVDLAVADGQRVQREALGGDHRRRGVGIEAPAQEHDGVGHRHGLSDARVSRGSRCTCAAGAAGGRSGGPRGSRSPAPADPARRGPARRAPRRRARPADGGRRTSRAYS